MFDEYLARIEFERTLYINDFNNTFRHNSWGRAFTPKQRDFHAMSVTYRSKTNPDEYCLPQVQRKWTTLLAIMKSLEEDNARD